MNARIGSLCLLILLVAASILSAELPQDKSKPLVVFFVRHAEKVDSSRDAELTELGHLRAKELARVLKDAELTHVHATEFKRTKSTAAPVAAQYGVKVQLYDRYDAKALVRKLRAVGGRHLVVGHSSSIPATIRELGGKPGRRFRYADEFDRLYVLSVDSAGNANTVLLRYGRDIQTK